MAKLTLNNGDVLHVRLESRETGEVDILCADTAKKLKDGPFWFIATLCTDGSLYPQPSLQGLIKEGLIKARLKFDKRGAIKVSR